MLTFTPIAKIRSLVLRIEKLRQKGCTFEQINGMLTDIPTNHRGVRSARRVRNWRGSRRILREAGLI